jgi:hypothetical protein
LTAPPTRFQYEPFVEYLDGYIEGLDSKQATRALRKLKFMVMATGWVDFQMWHPDVDSDQALAWAWEDMVMAFAGYGESVLTGTIVSLWNTVPKEQWEDFKELLNKAKVKADIDTPKNLPRRYFLTYRRQGARSPADGFNLPCLVPNCGHRTREWAEENGLDPDEIESQLMLVEEYERLGLIDLGDEVGGVVKGANGLKEVSLAAKSIENPWAEKPYRKPKLVLLPGGEGA